MHPGTTRGEAEPPREVWLRDVEKGETAWVMGAAACLDANREDVLVRYPQDRHVVVVDPRPLQPGYGDKLVCPRRTKLSLTVPGAAGPEAINDPASTTSIKAVPAVRLVPVPPPSPEPRATPQSSFADHLRRVEASWFQHRMAQVPMEDIPVLRGWVDDPDRDFRKTQDETVEDLIDGYDAQCASSREAAANLELDHVVPHQVLGEVSVRWIYVHMIEETARHAGHADILREQIDGSTGY